MNEIQLTGICSEMARLMIKYGAEIYRVEDTISRICHAYGHSEAAIYATPANFIITVKDKNSVPYTDSKSISGRDTNLDRVGKLNELSRFICSEKPEAEVIFHRIEQIKERKTYSPAISVIAVALSHTGLIKSFDKMIIGASMALVPGVALTNCMRDFISGDFISGIYTLTEAVLIAVGMAVGAGSAVAAVIKF